MGRGEHKEHKRKRSRSKERKRSRSRSPRGSREHREHRDRDRDRERRRERDTDREKTRDREKQRDAEKKKEKESKTAIFEMEESRNDTEEVMKMKEAELLQGVERRRRNVEKWRAQKKKEELDLQSEQSDEKSEKKPWNLEDEDDEDEFDIKNEGISEENPVKMEEKVEKMDTDDEEDPLDAFMKEIATKNAKKTGNSTQKASGIVTIVQEEKPEPEKGQVLENEDNMDMVIDDFDIETAAASLCHKGRMLAQTDHSKVYYRKFKKNFYIEVACTYGGVGISEQIADLKRGAEIVVCTPGRMIDVLAANSGKVTNLRRVTYLVLDEADRMFDKGFEPQIMKVVNNIRPDKQTVLFSATFPRHMEALARKVLDKPVEILVGGKSVVCSDITQNAVICAEHQKFLKLLELLGMYYEEGSSIVFVDKQEKADDIVDQLMRTGYNSVAPLHGGIDQHDRDSSIADFKTGVIKVLVATSVAARGLDVKNLILVVNYDCPNHYEDYVHRVGRTGRAGRKGYAYTFVLPEHQEKMAGEICRAFETAGCKPPADLKAMFERFKSEMAAEGKEVKLGGKGFEGSGYKYDEGEAEADANKKRMTRLTAQLQRGGTQARYKV
ncbi:RNA helicase [Caenorhabditis elegans]|uniref:RNA helicase n=1 Tax=Caenorhabditis elegans TaxID=6239 RepID=U4PBN2_CAEEL|nr:RNA helicase [Caenorhabditis elegans]CDH93274.1 RNA helicase [Caenorhabditis elegans]|eukprot:NP_001294487.1 Uncharacterized protein CELE_F53H1.1 [Caenorhabditis elegans]